MDLRTTFRSASLLAASVLCASAATAQGITNCVNWAETAHDPAGTLHVEGFLVAQEGVAGVEVFSASARKWDFVAPPGSTVVGKGDWCMLMFTPNGMTAYSARLNNSATLPFMGGTLPFFFDCHDDVCFVVGIDNNGLLTSWAYSAVHGVWVPQVLGGAVTPADYAISRFVVGIRDNNFYHGFSARIGAWSTTPGPIAGAPISADGNVLLADFTLTPNPRLVAFSGVRGCWTPSPLLRFGTPVLLDHNVVYARAVNSTPGTISPCAYSAYSSAWSLAPVPTTPVALEVVSDNVVLVNDPSSTAVGIQAFGAGHATWHVLPPNFTLLNIDEDYAMAVDPLSLDLSGFSGVCGGPWQFESNPSGAFPVPVVPPDHIGAADTGTSFHVFQPTMNTWAPTLPKTPLDTVFVADAVLEVQGTGITWGIDTRWGTWVPSPAMSPLTAGTGSVIAHQTGGGVVEGLDERCNLYNPPYPLVSGPSLMSPGRNLVVFSPPVGSSTGIVEAYSVQRGDWTSPGAIPLPLAVGPLPEENVAALVDGGGVLWAYGSPNDGHVYYQWPNCTEYHVSKAQGQNPNCKPVLLAVGMRSRPGNITWLLRGNTIQCPPLLLAGFCGELWMPLAGTIIQAGPGVHDPDCMIEYRIGLPPTLPPCIEPWFQTLTFDVGSGVLCFGCKRSDAAWIF